MTLNQSIADWINHKRGQFPSIAAIQLLIDGNLDDQDPPLIAIKETSAPEIFTQGDLVMHGISTFEIGVMLETVPAPEDEGGTSEEDHDTMRRDLYDIIGNRDAIQWLENRNGWSVIDIRATSPTTQVEEGRRMSVWTLSIIAHPS
jgi:hypothetical protein